MTGAEEKLARGILAHHSKSFALAGRLLPAWCRRDAAALYAWCRRCDDSVDFSDGAQPPHEAARRRVAAVAQLRRELDLIYGGVAQADPVLAAFQDVVIRHALPRRHADELVAGMAMDVGTVRYSTFGELLLYCYRAAGTVGLMMAQVMNVRDVWALRRAADLGIAMQLTNICRDVAEDERRGRVYLPRELGRGADLPSRDREGTAAAVAELLRRADHFYRSGDRGFAALPWRCAMAIAAARSIYAEIGAVIARQRFDVGAGRAVVSTPRKLWLLVAAIARTGASRLLSRFRLGQAPGDVASPLVFDWTSSTPAPRAGFGPGATP